MAIGFEEFMYLMLRVDLKTMDEAGNHYIELISEGRKKRTIYGRPAGEYYDCDTKRRCSVLLALFRLKDGPLVVQVEAKKDGWFSGEVTRRFCLDFENIDDLRDWLSDDAIKYRGVHRGITSAQHECLNAAKLKMGERLSQSVTTVLN